MERTQKAHLFDRLFVARTASLRGYESFEEMHARVLPIELFFQCEGTVILKLIRNSAHTAAGGRPLDHVAAVSRMLFLMAHEGLIATADLLFAYEAGLEFMGHPTGVARQSFRTAIRIQRDGVSTHPELSLRTLEELLSNPGDHRDALLYLRRCLPDNVTMSEPCIACLKRFEALLGVWDRA